METIQKLPAPSSLFKSLREVAKKRYLKIGVWGAEATGKTRFILTCPEPVYIIDTELGVAPLYKQFKDKDIRVIECFFEAYDAKGEPKIDAMKCLETIKKALDELKNVNGGTIAIDSGTDLWSWCESYMKEQIGEIGRKLLQWDWKIANELYKEIIMKAVSRKAHFVITAQPQEIYIGAGQRTGLFQPQWQKKTPFEIDIVLRFEKIPIVSPEIPIVQTKTGGYTTPTPKPIMGTEKTDYMGRKCKYIATIEKLRFYDMYNVSIENPTFQKLYDLIKEYIPEGE